MHRPAFTNQTLFGKPIGDDENDPNEFIKKKVAEYLRADRNRLKITEENFQGMVNFIIAELTNSGRQDFAELADTVTISLVDGVLNISMPND